MAAVRRRKPSFLCALGLLAVCAWLGNAGRNNKMFYVPMAFMLIVTLTSLVMTLYAKCMALAAVRLTRRPFCSCS